MSATRTAADAVRDVLLIHAALERGRAAGRAAGLAKYGRAGGIGESTWPDTSVVEQAIEDALELAERYGERPTALRVPPMILGTLMLTLRMRFVGHAAMGAEYTYVSSRGIVTLREDPRLMSVVIPDANTAIAPQPLTPIP